LLRGIFHLLLTIRSICILNRGEFLKPVHLKSKEPVLRHKLEERVDEQLELVPILTVRLDAFALFWIPIFKLFESFVVELVERGGLLAEVDQHFGTQHEHQQVAEL